MKLSGINFDNLRKLRMAVDSHESATRVAEHLLAQKERALAVAERSQETAVIDDALDEVKAAQEALEQAQLDEQASVTLFEGEYTNVLNLLGSSDPLRHLTSDRPLLLFPVRLETRFVWDGATKELRVRIFPEEFHIDSHEPELTDEELAWGQAFLHAHSQRDP